MNEYDRLAPYYDLLANIMSGGAVARSQTEFLHLLRNRQSLLVLGGGTGWWLKKVTTENPSLSITFIDASQKMIQVAKLKSGEATHISFVHGTVDSIPPQAQYDAVILFYFMDLFADHDLNRILNRIKKHSTRNSIWLIAEFNSDQWWHRLLLRGLYCFFRLTTQLNTTTLPQWQTALTNIGLIRTDTKSFYAGFIKSSVYQSQSNSDQMLVE